MGKPYRPRKIARARGQEAAGRVTVLLPKPATFTLQFVPADPGRKLLVHTGKPALKHHQPATTLRLSDDWLATIVENAALISVGIKAEGGGPHQSKTMMLAELTELLANDAADRAEDAILRDNLLGKPSIGARRAALYRLRQLYGVGESRLACIVLCRLWDRDPSGRPMLALLCALARDPTLRAGAAPVLDAPLGERVRWPVIAAGRRSAHSRAN